LVRLGINIDRVNEKTGVRMLGKIIHLQSKPKTLLLGDRKENFNKRFESIENKKQAIEKIKQDIKKGK
jgi:metallophosphoesterase superfamily enzyme